MEDLDALIKDTELKASFEFEDKMKSFIESQMSILDLGLVMSIKVESKQDIEKSINDLHKLIQKIAKESFNFGVCVGIRHFILETYDKYKE